MQLARATIVELSQQYGLPAPPNLDELPGRISVLQERLTAREQELADQQTNTTNAISRLFELERLKKEEAVQSERKNAEVERQLKLHVAKAESDRRIEVARDVARTAKELRTSIVRRVFNDDLNAVWRALFVRLAPDEDFVPAFALPDSPNGEVEAELETHYRTGGKGGNPRAMLSAGNLNTAALTLFLSLHLSVSAAVPCLIIDDPVQSMDEVHISQFAALLRTLSKEKSRQVVIAVHERSLFDYLALELSPSFEGDRLITVELSRALDGMSKANWEIKTFEPDKAIAA